MISEYKYLILKERGAIIMKRWEAVAIEVVELKNTEFGPCEPECPDSEKTQIVKPDGTVGWVQEFGKGENQFS